MVEDIALKSFLAAWTDERLFVQVNIRRAGSGFELRHVADRAAAAESLRSIGIADLRQLAQFTTGGAFRPLKCAPNLASGWRARAATNEELAAALDSLYPGALADWHAAQSPAPPVTHYREFTARQTGMYRIAAALSDEQAAQAVAACCHPDFCLKRRCWTVPGLAADAANAKSLVPCLEPCALMLEFARKVARIHQEEPAPKPTADTAAALASKLEELLAHPPSGLREADFSAPENPRRLRWELERTRHGL